MELGDIFMKTDEEKNKEFSVVLADMVKGLFSGGALGALVGFTGLIPFERAVWLGLLVGALASFRFRIVRKKQIAKRKKKEEEKANTETNKE